MPLPDFPDFWAGKEPAVPCRIQFPPTFEMDIKIRGQYVQPNWNVKKRTLQTVLIPSEIPFSGITDIFTIIFRSLSSRPVTNSENLLAQATGQQK